MYVVCLFLSLLCTNDHPLLDVQLKYLLRHSPVFRLASSLEPYRNVKETAYANALRSHAKQAIDVRFILNSESSSTRASVNSNRGASLQSGFEVRRNDHLTSTESNFSRYCKADWDKLTLYFVCQRIAPPSFCFPRLMSLLLP